MLHENNKTAGETVAKKSRAVNVIARNQSIKRRGWRERETTERRKERKDGEEEIEKN